MIVLGLALPKPRKDRKTVEEIVKTTPRLLQLSSSDSLLSVPMELVKDESDVKSNIAEAGKDDGAKVQKIVEESKTDGEKEQKIMLDSQNEVLMSLKKEA